MRQYLEGFALGNAAILGNVCMLPLYPGLFVLLADRSERGASSRNVRWLGLVVLAGVVSAMVAFGALLYGLHLAFADVLGVALPVVYVAVLVLGIAMIFDRNPLARIATGQVPLLSRPIAGAYVYGLALGPLTLPCTGPLVISAFVLGGVRGTGALADALVYFLCFALGFGWPLVLLPLVASTMQVRLTRVLTRHHRLVGVVSGVLLIGIAVVGWYTDIRPDA